MRYRVECPTLPDLLRARAAEQPEQRVYTFLRGDQVEEIFLTYEELDRRARAVGALLQSLGTVGDRILLIYPPGLDFIVAFYGCLYAGAVAVPVPPPGSSRNLSRVEAIAADSGATVGLGTGPVLSLVKRRMTQDSNLQSLHLQSTDDVAVGMEDDWQYPRVASDTLAYLQYTSGSTGMPRGVMINYRNLMHNSALIAEAWKFTPGAVHVLWMPTFHDSGLVAGVIQALYSGTSLIMLPPLSIIYNPMLWLQTISQYKATISGGMNFAFELCTRNTTPQERATLDLSHWQVAYCGGDMVHQETLDRFAEAFEPHGFHRAALCPAYGLAESTLLVTSTPLPKSAPSTGITVDRAMLEQDEARPVAADDVSAKAVVSCGHILGDQQVIVVHPESLQLCSAGQIGEIWVAGPSIAQGYWNNPQATAQIFNATLAEGHRPFLRTGDLGFWHDEELFITGRLKDLVIIRGRNLYPSDVEQTIEKSHQALQPGSGAVFSIEVGVEECLVVAHEVDRHCQNMSEVVRRIRQAVVEEYEVKVYAVALLQEGTIPKTSSGKIARRACREAFLTGHLKVVYEWQDLVVSPSDEPTDATQASLDRLRLFRETRTGAEIRAWLVSLLSRQSQIPLTAIDSRQPFTYYGLDSADVVNMIRQLELWLERPLTPTIAWDYPTVEQLARHLAGDLPAPSAYPTARASRPSQNEPIAIIGLGCRFPGAKTPTAFYELLHEGICVVVQVPASRWDIDNFYDPQPSVPGKMYTRRGSFLEQVEYLDSFVFGISPREATAMDPQQRLLLEVAWEALENAGQAPDRLQGSRTGVFIGISTNEYYQLQLKHSDPAQMDIYTNTGSALTFGANRLSYLLDLKGPSLAVDTACSSSLVATHLACQSLRSGESDMALAGGVSVILSPETNVIFCNQGILAADGRCKTFDATADGYARGEGCGLVVLKRLSDAVADGDRILALILGSAVNQDGRSNGLTAPNGLAQQAVIKEAMNNAGVSPSQLSYIEAHGTGTRLGDPIEVEALSAVLAQDTTEQPCFLGSVKTNIGHLEAAAGIAGLIKVVLSMQYGEIFPHLNFEKLNPYISLENTRLSIPTERRPWPVEAQRWTAGVSSFALGGTNAHVILGAPPTIDLSNESRPWHLLLLSAKTSPALETATANLSEHLKQNPHLNLADVAHTLQTGRAVFRHRRMLVCRDIDDAVNALTPLDIQRVFTDTDVQEPGNRPIVFMFPGQGVQHVNMGLELYQSEPTFREQIDDCSEFLQPHLELDLRQIMYPGDPQQDRRAAQKLRQTYVTQPALFVIEYALARLLITWGIHPKAMIGHSIGEYVAACLANVLSLEEALTLVAARGRLIQKLPGGAMLAIAATPAEVQPFLGPNLSLAALNGPKRCVVSGPSEAIDELEKQIRASGGFCRLLNTSHAFHSQMMEPILAEFAAQVRKISLSPPQIPYVSNLTGDWILAEEATDPGYYARHLRQTVRFTEGLNEILAEQADQILLEVGPGQTLKALTRRHPDWTAQSTVLPCLPGPENQGSDLAFLLHTLGKLWLSGVIIDWPGFYKEQRPQRIALPTYPFERQRYWIELAPAKHVGYDPTEDSLRKSSVNDWFYTPSWKRSVPAITLKADDLVNNPQTWLIFVDDQGLGTEMAAQLSQMGQAVIQVMVGAAFNRVSQDVYTINPGQANDYDVLIATLFTQNKIPHQIVHLWSAMSRNTAQSDFETLEQTQETGLYSVLFVIQALGKQKTSDLQIGIVSSGIQDVTGEERLCPARATILGLCQVIPLEYPHITCRSIDIAPEPNAERTERPANQLIAELMAEPPDTAVAYRGNHRWVQTFEKISLNKASEAEIRLKENGVYLITGGLGGIGLELAQYLARTVRARLILTGRSTFPARDEWAGWLSTHDQLDNMSQKIQSVQELENHGAEVLILRADVADHEQMRAAVAHSLARFGRIHGVIHAAGVPGGGVIQQKTVETVESILAPKVKGTLVLDDVLKNEQLDFFVLCSSLASVLGAFGQADYCAANAFLDAFAHHRNATEKSFTVCINWDAWQKVGMAAQAAKRPTGPLDTTPPQLTEMDHPLFDQCITESQDRQIYVTALSVAKHWVLREHSVIGKATLPGTAYLEMVRAAFESHTGNDAIEIREMFFLTPLTLEENEERKVRTILKRRGDVFEFSVVSQSQPGPGQWQEHATGEVAGIEATPPKQHAIREIEARCNEQEIIFAEEAGQPHSPVIAFGPRWRNLKQVKYGPSQGLALLELPQEFSADIDTYKLHPALMDCATGFLADKVENKDAYLPFSYRGLRIRGVLPRQVYSHARYIQDDRPQKETLKFSVTIMDDRGTELVEIKEYVMRKVDIGAPAPKQPDKKSETAASIPKNQNWRLEISSPGILDTLTFRPVPRRAPNPTEVEIKVHTAGLNFKDVLTTLGLLPAPAGAPMELGLECAGEIVALGKDAAGFSIGDPVIAFGDSCFSSFVTTFASLVAPKPDHLSFEEAVTIPVTFATAYYALIELGRLCQSDRILIHAAAGGVGLAAVQIAQWVGAEIWATAGNPEKRAFLHSLGIEHVMHSRTLDFADEVMERTDGRGVDVVLNSLGGEFLLKSLSVVAPNGRFLEIGKRDIYNNTPIGLQSLEKGISFCVVNPDIKDPGFSLMWRQVIQHFQDGHFKPLRHLVFPATEIAQAFDYMARARHIGKIVIALPDEETLQTLAISKAEDETRASAARLPTPLPLAAAVDADSHRKPLAPPRVPYKNFLEAGILPAEGVNAFTRILGSTYPQVLVSPHDLLARMKQNSVAGLYLPETAKEASGSQQIRPRPQSEIEQILVGLWQELLSIEEIGLRDDFFKIGGDSLLATQLRSRLRQLFRVDLPVASLFEYRSIADLAAYIETLQWAGREWHATPSGPDGEREEGKL